MENSKVTKLAKLVQALHQAPMTYTQMQKFVFNLTYPNRPFTRADRGWWSAVFTSVNGEAPRILRHTNKVGKLYYAK